MHPRDVAAVALLYREANQFTSVEVIEAWTLKTLAEFPEYHLVYGSGDAIFGAISATREKTTGLIQDIATLASKRRHGVGTLLLKTLLERFRNDGMKKVQLWVHKMSEATIPFYERHGFRILRRERSQGISDVPDGEEIAILEKNL